MVWTFNVNFKFKGLVNPDLICIGVARIVICGLELLDLQGSKKIQQ